MPKKKMWVEWEDGANLSKSIKEPGKSSPLTREADTHKLGQVTLSDIGEAETDPSPVFVFVNQQGEERDESAEALSALVSIALIVAIAKASPHVKQWWKANAVPAMKVTRTRILGASRRGNQSADSVLSADGETAYAVTSAEVDAAVDSPRVSMTSAEWQERFRLMLLAGAVQDEQWRVLRTARIEDETELLKVQEAMEKLSPQQVAAGIRLALDADRSLLDEDTSAELMKILAGIRVDDGRRGLPIGEQQPT